MQNNTDFVDVWVIAKGVQGPINHAPPKSGCHCFGRALPARVPRPAATMMAAIVMFFVLSLMSSRKGLQLQWGEGCGECA